MLTRMWIAQPIPAPDTHVAFRGTFEVEAAADIELSAAGASAFILWLDGELLGEGPARFDLQHPEYTTIATRIAAGRHVIAAHAINEGVGTKRLPEMPAFFTCDVLKGKASIEVQWKCKFLSGYCSGTHRINNDLGWIDWCDTRADPAGWQAAPFDDSSWQAPGDAGPAAPIGPPTIAPLQCAPVVPAQLASGLAADAFGYAPNDPAARFFLRDLECKVYPPQGVWRRYDLGRVRLGRPRFKLNVPAGTVVEFAYSEALRSGRVSSWITLSNGTSCNIDHFVARGGEQEFFPHTPRGGRFMEVHVVAPAEQVRFIEEGYVERAYHGEPDGSFECDDALLNEIWRAGIETYRACSEDAITDNPTRERGQWTGDAFVGMETASVAYTDLRLARRSLVQAVQRARSDGMVSALSPGMEEFAIQTYSAQWVSACLRYHELTGDRTILEELHDGALRNFAAFEALLKEDGVHEGPGWAFVDWGYFRPEGSIDPAMNLFYLAALRAMQRWCGLISREGEIERFARQERQLSVVLTQWIASRVAAAGWKQAGYHITALALRYGLVQERSRGPALDYLKQHILDCFPNNPDGPRLSDPEVSNPRIITPFFAHHTFPPLIEAGEMDFVLKQYQHCWGWLLQDGRTTLPEVFDLRWSHCHQWSACPTWQLSRYVLGLHPRFDRGARHFELNLIPGSLKQARGRLPLADGAIDIQWQRAADGIKLQLRCEEPIRLASGDPSNAPTDIRGTFETLIAK